MILTDGRGVPIERPRREDHESLADYARALHAHNDRVARVANEAFSKRLVEALRVGRGR